MIKKYKQDLKKLGNSVVYGKAKKNNKLLNSYFNSLETNLYKHVNHPKLHNNPKTNQARTSSSAKSSIPSTS
jgi:hypothetical protein